MLTFINLLRLDILDISSQNMLRTLLFCSHNLVSVSSELRGFICGIMFKILLQKTLGNQDFKLKYCMSKRTLPLKCFPFPWGFNVFFLPFHSKVSLADKKSTNKGSQTRLIIICAHAWNRSILSVSEKSNLTSNRITS